MIPQRITIDGYNGTLAEDTSTGPAMKRVADDLDRLFPDGWRDRYNANDLEVRAKAHELFQYHLFMPFVVKLHNDALPAAQQHATAANLVPMAVAAADGAYDDLNKNTTVNWMAAHHRFILASVEARRLLTEVVDAASALRDSKFGKEMKDLHALYYERVPAEQRIAVPDVDAAELELAEFVERTRERIDILRATVSGGYPAGFAPAPAPAEVELAQDDWDGFADDVPASVAAVVAGRGRGW